MYPDNTSQQVVHCRCPKNSVAYLVKRHAYNTEDGAGYQYSFACSPQTVRKCILVWLLDEVTGKLCEEIHITGNYMQNENILGSKLIFSLLASHNIPARQTHQSFVNGNFLTHYSPLQKLKCQRKEPCRLFSVKKSSSHADVDEVTMSSLCSCPHSSRCPKHHLDIGVVPGRVYSNDDVRTYSGYCM